MEESEPDTAPPMPMNSTPYKTLPPKKLVVSYAEAHNREGLERLYPHITVPPSKMLELLGKQFPNSTSPKPTPKSTFVSNRDYIRYLNRLSSIVYDDLGMKTSIR